MNQLCDLASTGSSVRYLQYLAAILLIVCLIFLWQARRKHRFLSILIVGVILSLSLAPLTPTARAFAASNTCSSGSVVSGATTTTPKIWTPANRFRTAVFNNSGDIDTQQIAYGTESNFAQSTETIYMTVNQPKASVDSETARPLIVAMTGGGGLGGFCNSTFTEDQTAMLELAKLGYVTVTLTPLLDPAFCDGEPGASYVENMLHNLSAANKALDYLFTNASTFKIDPDRTALYGYSIGGQTTLLKLRSAHNGAPHVRVLAAFSAIAPTSADGDFSPFPTAGADAPSVLMISFEPDIGFGVSVTPDARGDCLHLVSIGYDCQFGGMDYPSHAVHPNYVSPYVISSNNQPVNEYFQDYMYNHLVNF